MVPAVLRRGTQQEPERELQCHAKQRNRLESIRNGLDPTSAAFKRTTQAIQQTDKALQKLKYDRHNEKNDQINNRPLKIIRRVEHPKQKQHEISMKVYKDCTKKELYTNRT